MVDVLPQKMPATGPLLASNEQLDSRTREQPWMLAFPSAWGDLIGLSQAINTHRYITINTFLIAEGCDAGRLSNYYRRTEVD